MNIHESAKHAFAYLQRRSGAYRAMFTQPLRAWRWQKRKAYRAVFLGPVGHIVLQDLARFARANETPWHNDPRVHAVLVGRHEMWLRIQSYLNLPDEELWKLYNPGIRLIGDDE